MDGKSRLDKDDKRHSPCEVLFWGCSLFILSLDNKEDKEPAEASKQRSDSVIHRAVVLLGPALAELMSLPH